MKTDTADISGVLSHLEVLVQRVVILAVDVDLAIDVEVVVRPPSVAGTHVHDAIEKLVVLSRLLQISEFMYRARLSSVSLLFDNSHLEFVPSSARIIIR